MHFHTFSSSREMDYVGKVASLYPEVCSHKLFSLLLQRGVEGSNKKNFSPFSHIF